MKLWRVARAVHASTGAEAFSGSGGAFVDGRWHSRGRLVVYTARTESLARLEALVHFNPTLAPRLVLVEADLPDALVMAIGGTLEICRSRGPLDPLPHRDKRTNQSGASRLPQDRHRRAGPVQFRSTSERSELALTSSPDPLPRGSEGA
ncbi:MAG: RES family NAD+ phosphorylase [Myxococcales bacterium]|nr:RES family NAD+ phosphorylase [Myxococcales bacterium]